MLRWVPIRVWIGSRLNPYGKCRLNKLEFLQKISQQLQTKQQSQVASAEVPQQLEDHRQAEAVPVAAAPSEQQLQSILDNWE